MSRNFEASLAALLICASLAIACSDEQQAEERQDANPPSGSAPAGAEGRAGQTVTVRFVNLWVDDGAGAPVDVYTGYGADPEKRLLESASFGEVTGSATMPAGEALTVYRSGDTQAIVASAFGSDIEPGASLTLVLRYARPLRGSGPSGVVDVFTDSGDELGPGHGPARPVDGVLLVANVSPAGSILGDAHESLVFGIPGRSCLRGAGMAPEAASGGTATMSYDIEPGTSRIAAYEADQGSCSGTPRIGPVEVDFPAGARSYIFAYGTGPGDLQLLPVLPSGAR